MRPLVWLASLCAILAGLAVPSPALASAAAALDPPVVSRDGYACNSVTGQWSVGWKITAGADALYVVATHGTGEPAYQGSIQPYAYVRTTSVTLPAGATTATISVTYNDPNVGNSQTWTVTASTTFDSPCPPPVTHHSDPVGYFVYYCAGYIGAYMENKADATTNADFQVRWWTSQDNPAGSVQKIATFTILPGQHQSYYLYGEGWIDSFPVEIYEYGVQLDRTYHANMLTCGPTEQPMCPCVSPPPPGPGTGGGTGSGSTGSGGSASGGGGRPAASASTPAIESSATGSATPSSSTIATSPPTRVRSTAAQAPTRISRNGALIMPIGGGAAAAVIAFAVTFVVATIVRRRRAAARATPPASESDPIV